MRSDNVVGGGLETARLDWDGLTARSASHEAHSLGMSTVRKSRLQDCAGG